jgi:hypothetical protein
MALGLQSEFLVDLGHLVGDTCWGRVDSGSVGQEIVQGGDSLCSGEWAGSEDLEPQWWRRGTGGGRHR